jgi:uncharacterized protein YbjT (DUF2867 family)
MKRILVTGATGNIGSEVIHYLIEQQSDCEIIAAVRNVDKGKIQLKEYPSLVLRKFDFENPDTFQAAFQGIDVLFLLRPPQISDVDTVFRPLCLSARENGIKNIVFLSVQGAEKSKVIPHNKIERLIQELKFNYIFMRPSYFMQNLTTTLLHEITHKKSITLPAGKAKFNWIDVKNIGEATAIVILNFEKHHNRPYELTGTENKNFAEVVSIMTEIIGEKIMYKSINPISFYFRKRKEALNSGYALVMTILHFLPRLQKEPVVSSNYKILTGKNPTQLKEFMSREKVKLTTPR